jgi:sugar phosphate isomerase/epimerase
MEIAGAVGTTGTAGTAASGGDRLFDGIGPGTGPTTSPESLAAALEEVARLGATGTQLSGNGWDVVMNGRVFAPRLERFRRVVEGCGLRRTFHAPIAELNLMAPDPEFQELEFRAWLEVAGALGCPTMTYHPGRFDPAAHPAGDPGTLLSRERDALARLAEVGAGLGVVIACENLVTQRWWPAGQRQYSCEPEWLTALVSAVGHPNLAICFDLGHLQLSAAVEGYDYLAAARRLIPHAVVLHVHDNFAKPTRSPLEVGGAGAAMQLIRGEGDLHLPLGWGVVPLEATFAEGGFARRPILVLEVDSRYWRDDPAVAQEIVASGRSLASRAVPAATG